MVDPSDDEIRNIKTRALEYGMSEPAEVARLVMDELVRPADIAALAREREDGDEEAAANDLAERLTKRIAALDYEPKSADW
jgi:uncharacterized membrane protein YebE (DUF533 family)